MGERSKWTSRLTANREGRSALITKTKLNSADPRFIPDSNINIFQASVVLDDESLRNPAKDSTSDLR